MLSEFIFQLNDMMYCVILKDMQMHIIFRIMVKSEKCQSHLDDGFHRKDENLIVSPLSR
jgi:hypothetical protein